MKICNKCKQSLPEIEFGKNKPRKDGLNTRCKKCACLESSIYAASNKEKVAAKHAAYRIKNHEKIRENRADYYLNHMQIEKERARKWNLDNKEKYQTNLAIWRVENKNKIKETSLVWRGKNINRISNSLYLRRLLKKDFYSIAAAKWRQSNPEKLRIYNQNRRARLLNTKGELSIGLARKLYILQRERCACCGKRLGGKYHLDHRMPLALGGENVDLNIQLLCQYCNLSKHKKHPIEFMQSRGFLL